MAVDMSGSHSRRWRRWPGLVLALAVMMLPGALSPTVAAAGVQPVHPGFGYLALGDSVAFGYRPPAVTPQADYFDADNFVGYPEDLAAARSLRLANASCPGETTASMITAGAQSNGCENSLGSPVGYRTVFPLHVAYSGTQLAFAVDYLRSHPRTRLVTINIGANDLFLCQATTADRCTGADFPAALRQISENLTTILTALRETAHYHHDLALLTYYSLNYADPVQVAGTTALNAALVAVAARFDVVVADGFAAFLHASQSFGGDSCAAGLLIALPGGGCNIHPSALGHQVLAAAVDDVVPSSP
ncbi:MAG: SGNH/GDSL hydrolase family protein [Mycobacteriales bacterium]